MEGAALEIGIELHLLETTRRAEAFLIARRNIDGGACAFFLGFGAFKNDDFSWHGEYGVRCSREWYFREGGYSRAYPPYLKRFFSGSAATLCVGLVVESKEGSDGGAESAGIFLLVESFLVFDGAAGEGHSFQAHLGNGFARSFADAVAASFDPDESFFDFVQRVLLLREDVKREVAIVGVTASVGLMHAECGCVGPFFAASERVTRHSVHLVDESVAEIEKLLLLFAEESGGEFLRLAFLLSGRRSDLRRS